MKGISVQEIEELSFRLAKAKLEYGEPIPEFSTRYPNVLESCLLVPFQKFEETNLYSGLIEKASILFYLMIKNHLFGDKRIAMTTLFLFLWKNNKWLRLDNQELYNFALWVAQSPSDLKEDTVSAINRFLSKYLEKKA